MQLTPKHFELARSIADAHPLKPAKRIRAKGNHLAAANDEPEPLFTEAQLLQGDRDRQARKDDLSRGCDERQMRRESDLHWQARNVEDFIRGGQ